MYTYSAGSPHTFKGYGGFGAVTHEEAQAQAAIDFQKQFGHPVPPRSLAEANWLNDRTAALKAVTGAEETVVTRDVEVPADPRVLGPVYLSTISAAIKATSHAALIHTQVPVLLQQAHAAAASLTTAGLQKAKGLYYQAKQMATAMGYGAGIPYLPKDTQTAVVKSGGGVPSQPIGTASVLKNLSESMASIYVRKGEPPPGPYPKAQPQGGLPAEWMQRPSQLPAVKRAPWYQGVQDMLDQRVGPVTVKQIAMGGGAVLAVLAIMRNIVPLALIGGSAAAGAWWLGQKGYLKP